MTEFRSRQCEIWQNAGYIKDNNLSYSKSEKPITTYFIPTCVIMLVTTWLECFLYYNKLGEFTIFCQTPLEELMYLCIQ